MEEFSLLRFGFVLIRYTILLQIGTCAMVKHYNTSTGRSVLCESVKCQGALEFCQVNYTRDICNPCPLGSYMVDTIDSRYFENDRSVFKCVDSMHWSCPPEAEMVYGKITDTHQPPCECDRSRGYYGSNFYNCELVEEPCGKGLELSIRGNCVPCPYGTFKRTKSFELCIKKTNCTSFNRYTISHGSTYSDAICGPLMHITASTEKGHKHYSNNDFEKSTIDVHSIPYQSKTSDEISNIFTKRNIFLIIIIIPAVILVIVGPIAIGFCIKNKYSVHIKCCMEINRKSDRSSRKTYEIPLKDQEKGSVGSGCTVDPQPLNADIQMDSGHDGQEESDITRITVHVHSKNDTQLFSEDNRNSENLL
ncbi:uncharacterized protein LOC127720515 isoform X1 [Mytilus californianus]|uniref:uncharacterized protein LOC127720515 isoform X1 n=1 Tax=Mytilus californianus TaxID=6549 RepID=UPI002247FDD9|nr:uncharacterized protein LOC127720515 isoform X1 [Mytilus californianus]